MGQLRLWVFAGAIVLAGTAACGQEFSASQSTATVGSGSGSGGGDATSSGSGAGLPSCTAGDFPIEPLLYTTLDSYEATTMPEIGLLGVGAKPLLSYEETPDQFGVVLNSDGGTFRYPSANFADDVFTIHPRGATVDFCFKPEHDSIDGKRHNFFRLFENAAEEHTPLRFYKSEENNMVLEVWGQRALVTVDPSYKSGEWIRLTVAWAETNDDFLAAVAIDGDELNKADNGPVIEPLEPLPNARPSLFLQFGDPLEGGNEAPDGVLDELHVFEGFIEETER